MTRNTWFWMLQLVSWGAIAAINTYGKLSLNKALQPSYIIIEGLVFFLSGVIASTLLRNFLNKRIDFNALSSKDYKTILLGYATFSSVFFLSLFIAVPFYIYYHHKPLKMETLVLVSNLINAFTFILFWLVFYISIKLFFVQRKNKIERLELENSLKESQLNTLKGQINPHFMFNSMNNIRGLMLEDVEKSREMLTRLSDLLRYSLTKSKVDIIPLEDELEMVDHYISLSKIQLEERLTYQQDVPPELLHQEIPPMLILMLVENAIKHGISNLPQGGVVHLSVNKKDDFLQIKVSNTGKILPKKGSTQVGLENIEKRLALIYKKQAKFSLEENGKNVIATIQIPLK